MANEFLTKKEFEQKVFWQKHKRDEYGKKWLKVCAIIGFVIIFMFIFGAKIIFDMTLLQYWKTEMKGHGIWAIIYLWMMGCSVVYIYLTIKKYLDLDSEYKAYMASGNVGGVISQNATMNINRQRFCGNCGAPVSNETPVDGYCAKCGSKLK